MHHNAKIKTVKFNGLRVVYIDYYCSQTRRRVVVFYVDPI